MAGLSYIDETNWAYTNPGTADLLSSSGTTLTNLPENQSRTGSAFYQTTRAKCFDIPATPEIWIKFDVFTTLSTRWRAYNENSNGVNGVCSQTDGALDFWANSGNVTSFSRAVKNQLQSVLLHMASDSSSGIVEAWLNGVKLYTYTGNVNYGSDFADIYLQSDGSGTFFSNVIISNIASGIETSSATYDAIVKPEIFISWIPRGNIAVKPEFYATVYRAPQRVRISADTARTLKKSETVSADSFRQLGNGVELSADSSRKIRATVNLTGDATRAIKFVQSTGGDTGRLVEKLDAISVDTFRTVKSTQIVTADTCREVFKFEPQLVRISGAVGRKVTRAEFVTADTFSRAGVRNAATGDTRRSVRFDVLTSISLDTARKVVKTSTVTADTNIYVTRSEIASGDSFRQVGTLNFVRADSFRLVKKFLQTLGDTRLAYGICQNISADTFRQLNYHIWQVDDSGTVIQINRPRGNHILIGSVKTLSVNNWRIIPDDRQRKIETIGGIVVEDFGHVAAGDKISCKVTLDAASFSAVENYWHNRICVTVTDEAGRTWNNLRVKIKSYSYIPHFPNYFSATLEFWKE